LLVFRFDIENKLHVLHFADQLMTLLINVQPVKLEFGGDPKPIFLCGKKHLIQLTKLPRGIRPGFVNIYGMEIGQLSHPPLSDKGDTMTFGYEPALPVIGKSLFSANLGIHIMRLLV
jgi:hypothetical protein